MQKKNGKTKLPSVRTNGRKEIISVAKKYLFSNMKYIPEIRIKPNKGSVNPLFMVGK